MPSNPKIKKVDARMIFDSRGIPTIEADVILDDGLHHYDSNIFLLHYHQIKF